MVHTRSNIPWEWARSRESIAFKQMPFEVIRSAGQVGKVFSCGVKKEKTKIINDLVFLCSVKQRLVCIAVFQVFFDFVHKHGINCFFCCERDVQNAV